MNAPTPRLVVCIPTYRRANQLARLLQALRSQRSVEPFAIVVGNNDARPLTSWPELCDPTLPAFRSLQVATRGVSAVRNAMLGDVARDPAVRWIACLDDDQVPDPDWLSALVAAGERFDADLVGGPVVRTAAAPSFWSHAATDASYLPTAAGPTPMLNEAGNLLVATRFLREIGRAPFAADFGRTGGEDYELFLFARRRGSRVVWAPDARVVEPLPADRVTFGGLVRREYAIGAYQARADLLHRGRGAVVASIFAGVVRIPVHGARALRRRPRVAALVGAVVQSGASLAGRIAGLAGHREARYGGDVAEARAVDPRGRVSE